MSVLKLFRQKRTEQKDDHLDDPTCEMHTPSPTLEKLRELTNKLQGVPAADIISPAVGPSSYAMMTERGERDTVEIFPLYFDGLMRIERAFIPKGHRLKAHYHEGEIQHISVVKGDASIKMCPPGEKPKVYHIPQGRSVYVPAKTPHNFQANEDCYIVNVFMSCPSEGDGRTPLALKPTIVETEFEDE